MKASPRDQRKSKKTKKQVSSDEDEYYDESQDSDDIRENKAVQEDTKMMIKFVKKIQKEVKLLPQGVKDFYLIFDKDGSDKIEFVEFLRMLEYLKIGVQESKVRMLFSLFDRQDAGYFNYISFEDIIENRMTPNYEMVVKKAR